VSEVSPYRTTLVLLILCCVLFSWGVAGVVYAQYEGDGHTAEHGAAMGHDHHSTVAAPDSWEGSVAGIAYSEQNHHIAGWMVILMGLAEVSHVMRLPSLMWARLLLPSAMLFVGIFLIVWSDHEAWPVGHLSFAETFFGQDHEIVQHKFYGLLALAVGGVELFRRLGRVGHVAWATPLPLMAIIGGIMLFSHSHGVHPSAHKIAMHHAVMGTIAITAGSSKLFFDWHRPSTGPGSNRWEWLWAGLILAIGAQLLIYSE
jgi:hypothetical protein